MTVATLASALLRAAPAAVLAAGALTLALTAPRAQGNEGREIYQRACALCHSNMPPKLGDKRDWEPRMKLGTDSLANAVIKGKGAMPPRGGNSRLTDAEIRAAVEYMLASVK